MVIDRDSDDYLYTELERRRKLTADPTVVYMGLADGTSKGFAYGQVDDIIATILVPICQMISNKTGIKMNVLLNHLAMEFTKDKL